MEEKILVSTIIPTYKRADTLPRAINSVLSQTHKNIEVIIVDDNNPSTNDRIKVEQLMIKYEHDNRVIYVKHEKNMNGSVARNTGILVAKGKYICFLDDDNYFYENKIKKQVQYLENNPNYSAVYCGLDYKKMNIIPTKKGNLMYEQFKGTNIIDTNMIMMCKDVAVSIGGWDERLKRNQDTAFMVRYFEKGYEIGVISEALAYIDLSDRINVASPENNERNFDHFFKYYQSQLKELELEKKGAIKDIYSFRYRGVFYSYIKHKKFGLALKLYLKMMKKSPFLFNIYLLQGFYKKTRGKDLFEIQ